MRLGVCGRQRLSTKSRPFLILVINSSQLPPAHESLPPTPQTHAPPNSAGGSNPPGSAVSGADSQASGSQVINMRCLIVTMDASVIIGKQGRHIAEIRVGSELMVTAISRARGADCGVTTEHRAKRTRGLTSQSLSPETPKEFSAFKERLMPSPRRVFGRALQSSSPFTQLIRDRIYSDPTNRPLDSSSGGSTMNRLTSRPCPEVARSRSSL